MLSLCEGRVRHNEGRDLTGDPISTECKDVELAPTLQPLTGWGTFYENKSVNTEGSV